MTLPYPSPDFDRVVAAVCHGTATESEMHALNVLLRGDRSARDEYLVRIEVHARLASQPDLFCRPEAAVGWNSLPTFPPGERRDARALHSPPPEARSSRRAMMALAACLALTAVGAWAFWNRLGAPAREGATSTAVAMLTHSVDARWRTAEPPRTGSALAPGWLRLESGLAQVVFYSGVRLVLEGPAELELVSQTEAVCPVGRLLAEVPEPARGFRLRTDQLDLLDLGTEFGIDASQARTEVHVFKGRVELFPATARQRSLGEGQAALVTRTEPLHLMVANAGDFIPMFEFQRLAAASEATRYYEWRLASARLDQDPSLLVHLDFEGLDTSDWTVRNRAAGEPHVPDAAIIGCQRAEGRWRQKQALEFRSVNDRLRLSVPGEHDALTLSAWVCVKGLDRQFNSLFMCDGFEAGTIHWLIRNDGVLGLTVFGLDSHDFQILATPPVLTLDQLGMWIHLAVVLDGTRGQAIHYFNGSPVAAQTLKLAPPFRVGAAELGNWNAQHSLQQAPFLIRNLSGSLDEFELFSRALSDQEIRQLYVTGKPEA